MPVLLLQRGRWSSARAAGDSLLPHDQDWDELVAVMAALPFLVIPPAELERLRRRVEAWDSVAVPTGGVAERLRPQRRLYVLGQLSARLRDFDGALRRADAIERLPAPPGLEAVARGFADQVRAVVAFQRADFPGTLAYLQQAPATLPMELMGSPVANGERERFLRAESLFQLGRMREALPWYRNGFASDYSDMYAAPCYLRLAEIHDRLGERDSAAH